MWYNHIIETYVRAPVLRCRVVLQPPLRRSLVSAISEINKTNHADVDVIGSTLYIRPHFSRKRADFMNLYECIDRVDISTRSRNCLLRAGVDLVYDLVHLSEAALLSIRNINDKSIADIKDFLRRNGLTLASNDLRWPSVTDMSNYAKNHTPNSMFVTACKHDHKFQHAVQICINEMLCAFTIEDGDIQFLIDKNVEYTVSVHEMLLELGIIEYLDIKAISARASYLFLNDMRNLANAVRSTADPENRN